jgi:hypothetical protein
MCEKKSNPCPEFEERIIRHAFHELGFFQRHRLKQHLCRCDTCLQSYEEFRRLHSGFGLLETETLPEPLLQRIWHHTACPAEPHWPINIMNTSGPWRLAAAAAILLIMAVAVWQFVPKQNHPQYSQAEIATAKEEVETALGIFGDAMNRTQKAIESQASVKKFARPIRKSLDLALKPLLNGG